MCGLAGLVIKKNQSSERLDLIYKMSRAIRHRGPDQEGNFIDNRLGVSLGHSRLSILDLSKNGNQPMHSDDERFVLVFNGEIYNHAEIRRNLISQGIKFRSNTDTETLLYGLQVWGIHKTLDLIRGMFAFALLDRLSNEIFLARDFSGEKPLYYGFIDGSFVFASELKAITANKYFKREIDHESLSAYFKYGYIPTPKSIWQGINKLSPGSFIKFSIDSFSIGDEVNFKNSPHKHSSSIPKDFNEAKETLHFLLKDSIKEQLVADVPVGAFLSGGIDSSLVVSIASTILNNPIKTFTIGFAEKNYDESQHASEVSSLLNTHHHQMTITDSDALEVISKLPIIFDEPFGDPSSIPTYLVSRLARQQVTVSLSGDAGDELFGGYSRYFNPSFNYLWSFSRKLRLEIFNKNIKKLGICNKKINMLVARDFEEFYELYTHQWVKPPLKLNKSSKFHSIITDQSNSNIQKMMEYDFNRYLSDCILAKVDRCSMQHSLESRIPLLDRRIIEFSRTLPIGMIVNHNNGKYILREILREYIPLEKVERPKQGFGIPIYKWFTGGLFEEISHRFSESELKKSNLLDEERIIQAWNSLKKGNMSFQHPLWLVFIFQQWYEENFNVT